MPMLCLRTFIILITCYKFICFWFYENSGESNGFTPRFLGFSLYISNTTNPSQGSLCFKDSHFNLSTIPTPIDLTCPGHGQYVIYNNERKPGVTYPAGYSQYAFNEICELEVYGKHKFSIYVYSFFHRKMVQILKELKISSF